MRSDWPQNQTPRTPKTTKWKSQIAKICLFFLFLLEVLYLSNFKNGEDQEVQTWKRLPNLHRSGSSRNRRLKSQFWNAGTFFWGVQGSQGVTFFKLYTLQVKPTIKIIVPWNCWLWIPTKIMVFSERPFISWPERKCKKAWRLFDGLLLMEEVLGGFSSKNATSLPHFKPHNVRFQLQQPLLYLWW